jgi:hypothetical protein
MRGGRARQGRRQGFLRRPRWIAASSAWELGAVAILEDAGRR